MRFIRPISAGAAALAIAAGLTGPAVAQTASGTGTSLTSTKVLTAALGDSGSLLSVELLTDEAQATIDSAVATPGSYSRIGLGKVSSGIVATDVVNKTLPVFEAKSTGPTSTDVTAGALDLAAPVLDGTVSGGKLTATLEDGVAAAGMNVGLTNVTDAIGGLLSIGSVSAVNEAKSAADSSTAVRSASVSDVTVLDLGAVLQGLGIHVGSMSVTQVAALVDGLAAQTGLSLPSSETTLTGAITTLNTAIDDLQAALEEEDTVDDLTGAIDSTTETLIGELDLTSPLPDDTTTTVDDAETLITAVVDELQGELETLISEGLVILDSIALLRAEGVEVSVATKAVEGVAASTATVTGKVGKISVGNLPVVENLDLIAATDAISASVASVNTKLGEVLGEVHPDLATLVKVAVLDKATEVTTKDGYTTATAGVTALSATLTPPAALAAIIDAINATTAEALDEVFEVLGVAIEEVPVELGLSTLMNSLAATLSLGFGALTQPASVSVAQVLSASNYRVGAATTGAPGGPELPRTGGDTLLLTAAAAVLLGLLTRRVLFTEPQPKAVRIKK